MTDTPASDISPPEATLPETLSPDISATGMEEMPDTATDLSRPQKRVLKRLYNARTVPVIADDRPFLTYRDAMRYLLSLPLDKREAAYAQMKAQAKDRVR